MKKTFMMALACSLLAAGANAQTETYYGSEKGGFAIAIDADPAINFVGNMFNGTQENYFEGFGTTLAGKYFVSNQFAVTAELGISGSKLTEFSYDDPEADDEITSKSGLGDATFSIGVGFQYLLRPGKRLQPFIGANVYYGRANQYTFAKAPEYKFEDGEKQRETTYETGTPLNALGLQTNIGIEYFLGKNVSISAALDFGVYSATTKDVSKFETDDKDLEDMYDEELNYNKRTGKITYYATNMMGGSLAFNFYF